MPHMLGRRRSTRNALCDKLLEARLSTVSSKAVDRALLVGGRKHDGSGSRIGATRDRVAAVFHRYAHGGSICLGSPMMKALLMLDHPYPLQDMVKEIVARNCGGRAALDCDDFVGIVRRYEERLRTRLLKVFADHAQLGADALGMDLLPRALLLAGVPAMPGVVAELQSQLREEQGYEVEAVGYTKFERLYHDVMLRAGLTEKEFHRLSSEYEAKEDVDGTVGERDLVELLAWNEGVVNMVGGIAFVEKLAAAVIRETQLGQVHLDLRQWVSTISADLPPLDRTASRAAPRVCENGFLVAARIMHDKLLTKLQATMVELGLPIGTGGTFRALELMPVIEELGYLNAMPASIHDIMATCKFHPDQPLTFEEVYFIIFRFVCSNGLSEEEVHDIAVAFWKFSTDGSRMLDVIALGSVIRWLGFQPNQFRMYCFAGEAALQQDARLSLGEVTNLVAQFVRSSLALVQKVFQRSQVRMTDLGQLLSLLGYDPTQAELDDLHQKVGGDADRAVDFAEFKRLERLHRKAVRSFMENNCGCTPAEMKRYTEHFAQNTEARPGLNGAMYMSQKAMRDLLLTMFPDSALNRERHVRISQLVRDADIDGNGMFDFQEFQWFMRQACDIMDREQLQAGLALKKTLGYSEDEVKQFRDLYALSDSDANGSIDADELCGIFGNLINMDAEAEEELKGHFAKVDNGDGKLDFWEFLLFMRAIQDENWRNLGAPGSPVRRD